MNEWLISNFFSLNGAFAIFVRLVPMAFKMRRRGPTVIAEDSRDESANEVLEREPYCSSTMAPTPLPNEKLTVACAQRK